MFSKTNS